MGVTDGPTVTMHLLLDQVHTGPGPCSSYVGRPDLIVDDLTPGLEFVHRYKAHVLP